MTSLKLLKPRHGASRRSTEETTALQQSLSLWLRRVSVMVALGLCGFGVYWVCQQLLDSTRFPLRYVHLYGELRFANKAELEETLTRYPGQNFFLLNIDQLRLSLSDLPWIEQVKVQRSWPDSIMIELRERRVLARWGDNELLDSNGLRFHPDYLPRRPGWPFLYGPEGSERLVIAIYQQASEMLLELGLKIDHLVQDQRLAWWLTLNNGVKLKLGKDESGDRDLMPRLRRFVEIYPKVLAANIEQIEAVDMRYPQGFSVLWGESVKTLPLAVKAGSYNLQKSRI